MLEKGLNLVWFNLFIYLMNWLLLLPGLETVLTATEIGEYTDTISYVKGVQFSIYITYNHNSRTPN